MTPLDAADRPTARCDPVAGFTRRDDNADMVKSTAEWQVMNERVVRDYRARHGTSGWANPLTLVTTTGRRTGKPLVTPLNFSEDGDRLVVIASAGGDPKHPAWYLNLVANPEVTIERYGETF